MGSSDLRAKFNDVLIERIRSCQYPSKELMDRVEGTLGDREHATEYVDVLLSKITQYPSLHLLDRLSNVITRIEGADQQAGSTNGDGSDDERASNGNGR